MAGQPERRVEGLDQPTQNAAGTEHVQIHLFTQYELLLGELYGFSFSEQEPLPQELLPHFESTIQAGLALVQKRTPLAYAVLTARYHFGEPGEIVNYEQIKRDLASPNTRGILRNQAGRGMNLIRRSQPQLAQYAFLASTTVSQKSLHYEYVFGSQLSFLSLLDLPDQEKVMNHMTNQEPQSLPVTSKSISLPIELRQKVKDALRAYLFELKTPETALSTELHPLITVHNHLLPEVINEQLFRLISSISLDMGNTEPQEVRVLNALRRSLDIRTVGELLDVTPENLREVPHVGPVLIERLAKILVARIKSIQEVMNTYENTEAMEVLITSELLKIIAEKNFDYRKFYHEYLAGQQTSQTDSETTQ